LSLIKFLEKGIYEIPQEYCMCLLSSLKELKSLGLMAYSELDV